MTKNVFVGRPGHMGLISKTKEMEIIIKSIQVDSGKLPPFIADSHITDGKTLVNPVVEYVHMPGDFARALYTAKIKWQLLDK